MKTRLFKRFPEGACVRRMESPVGPLHLIAGQHALHAVLWPCDLKKPVTNAAVGALPQAGCHELLDEVMRQLDGYFNQKRKSFDLPLTMAGTPFQQAVWQALQHIPYGETISYEAIAVTLGGRNKVRAVGTANGMNPVSIIIPCHRVVGKDGSLTGFGGGLAAKQQLLALEGATAQLPLL
ncbi:methylated-DNA--[protein]-cysteine S-methyltransferase [Kordiimonas sp.]|uniref:methylated-DNA--[protein]-cysteine S-methyltransferase n=1 Tax=Kordiimonas sp. TaxID=1970157 RepID=UPI003A8DC12B